MEKLVTRNLNPVMNRGSTPTVRREMVLKDSEEKKCTNFERVV